MSLVSLYSLSSFHPFSPSCLFTFLDPVFTAASEKENVRGNQLSSLDGEVSHITSAQMVQITRVPGKEPVCYYYRERKRLAVAAV